VGSESGLFHAEKIAKFTKRPKSFFVKEALKEYLEDVSDVIEAQQRVNAANRELITLNEKKKLLYE